MTLIDSHCHPYMLKMYQDPDAFHQLMLETKEAGIEKMLSVAVDMKSAQQCIDLADRYEYIFASVGSHPSEKLEDDLSVETLLAVADHPKVIAIGETGLDYYYSQDGLAMMRERFVRHIHAAIQSKKPLIIHTRNARKDTVEIMRQEQASVIGGVMHCFTESLEMAKQCLDLGFYISFSGIVTFKNATELVEVLKYVPLERILIETDAPYLAPVPFRGKENQPQYVKYVAEKIAEIKKVSMEVVAQKTTDNFLRLFTLSRLSPLV